MAEPSTDTAPFSAFERMIAGRYLRARRKEGFISVIAGFSFIGILLGVATLIIVMAVMNGFRTELLNKVLGFNGHAMVYSANANPIPDYKERAENCRRPPAWCAPLPSPKARPWHRRRGRRPGCWCAA
jgi:lipoprotein-releasing system permease protein